MVVIANVLLVVDQPVVFASFYDCDVIVQTSKNVGKQDHYHEK